jgi:hypothetical protein
MPEPGVRLRGRLRAHRRELIGPRAVRHAAVIQLELSKAVVFVGIGRDIVQRELTRRHLAELMNIPYEQEFRQRFAWDNLYGNEITPRGVSPAHERAEDARRAESLRARLGAYERAILLGDRLARALGCRDRPKYEWFPLDGCPTVLASRTLHTSHRHWNAKGQGRGEYWAPMRAFLRTVSDL